jgi:hypothetical protein
MTKLDRMTEARDQLESRLKELRGDLIRAAMLRQSDRCEVLRAEYQEAKSQWRSVCRHIVGMKHEEAMPPGLTVRTARRIERIFGIG